jgi:hypothetical protein
MPNFKNMSNLLASDDADDVDGTLHKHTRVCDNDDLCTYFEEISNVY